MTTSFNYTGAAQSYVVPPGTTSLTVVLAGGAGGAGGSVTGYAGGQGGVTTATLAVTPGETLTVAVGGAGVFGSASATYGQCTGGAGSPYGGSGGGSTGILRGSTVLAVAGGGGGGEDYSGYQGTGGSGGGLTGGTGSGTTSYVGTGGTQTSGGSQYGSLNGTQTSGSGGYGVGGGGGGGGWWGGAGGYGGGGGSSYAIPAATNVTLQQGGNTGNGSVVISAIGFYGAVLSRSSDSGIISFASNALISGSSVDASTDSYFLQNNQVSSVGAIDSRNYDDISFPTKLTLSVGTTDQSLPVISTQNFPSPPFLLTIDRSLSTQEIVFVNQIIDSQHFGVTRGYKNSIQLPHAASAVVEHSTVSLDFLESNQHHVNVARDDHINYLRTDGTRHNTPIIHVPGVSIQIGMPSTSLPGDTSVEGVSTSASSSTHVHGRETNSYLNDIYFPVGGEMLYPATTTFYSNGTLTGEELVEASSSMSPYGNYEVSVSSNELISLPAPNNWLFSDGASYGTSTYPLLFAQIGYTYGGSEGYFNVPNRGLEGISGEFMAINLQGYLPTTNGVSAPGQNFGGIRWIIKADS